VTAATDRAGAAAPARDEPRRFLVAGATGLVGTALCARLEAGGHLVTRLVRGAPRADGDLTWDPAAGLLPRGALDGIDVIVNLAGESVAGGRWTEDRRRRILASRTRSTDLLARAAAAAAGRPSALVNASAIGIYGDRGDEVLDAASAPGEGFLADVCRAWEAATAPAQDAGVRTVRARLGVVLSARGGALAAMLTPFRLGVGGPIGSGRQWMSVVDLDDAVAALEAAAIDATLEGPVDVVCPEPIRQGDFARALGRALHRPAVVPLPALAVKAVLGDMGREMLLASQRVAPRRLQAAGFCFTRRDAASSLAAQLG
jgi:uncharacterized protein (TIGR01777 family)